jgi:Zn-dependent alcohol dehydrogenase
VCECPESAGAFVERIADALDQLLPCGHDLSEWCDRCETCGHCEDEGKGNGGKLAALRARVTEVEREREHLRQDLVDISEKCGVECLSQEEAVRRIAFYIADHKTPAEREVIEAAGEACECGRRSPRKDAERS